MNGVLAFVSALMGAGIFSFIQFLITRHDNHNEDMTEINNKLAEISKQLAKQEKDQVRTQMIVMMGFRPKETTEIMKLAQHYFGDLEGNWYMTSMFNSWLDENQIGKPEWFRG